MLYIATIQHSKFGRQCFLGSGRRQSSSSGRLFEPLRVLFCGSDDFSAASLHALHNEHIERPDVVAALHVVSKKPKPTGRGLKVLREVPIASLARRLSLPLHQIDTFRGWQPPVTSHGNINLIIAVSFGLLVPPRLLNAAKYGGLNLHPSLLPDLRGAAPLIHTLLQQRQHTGVTVQTLHPTKMDHGIILAQTPSPGLRYNTNSIAELTSFIAPKGADLLAESIRKGLFVPPLAPVGWCSDEQSKLLTAAPKITKEDRRVQWQSWTADEILQRASVIGPLFNTIVAPPNGEVPEKRIIWTSGFQKSNLELGHDTVLGKPILVSNAEHGTKVLFPTVDNQLLEAKTAKFEGHADNDIHTTAAKAKLFTSPDRCTQGLR